MRKLAVLMVAVMALMMAGDWLCADTPDISGTEWTLTGSVTANAKRVGRFTDKDALTLVIGPGQSGPDVLAEDQWKLTDSAGDSLMGSYHERQDSPGKGIFHFEPDAQSLADYLALKLAAAADGADLVVNDLSPCSADFYPKGKGNRKGLSLNVSARLCADVDVTLDGTPLEARFTLNIRAKGLIPADGASDVASDGVAGSHWLIEASDKTVLSGMGKLVPEEDIVQLIFGPDEGEQLLEGEFLARYLSEGETIKGTYQVKGRKITFEGVDDEFYLLMLQTWTEELDEMIGPQGYQNPGLELTDLKVSATVKPGVSLKLNLKAKFWVSAEFAVEVPGQPLMYVYDEYRGTYLSKGVGEPDEP